MQKNSLWTIVRKKLEEKQPVLFNKGGLILTKDASGGYNLLGKFTNRWRDIDFHSNPLNGGDIVTNDAHKEFSDWLDKHPQHALELWSYHAWGTARKSRANWWGYTGNSFYMNWPLTDEEAKSISEWVLDNEPGMSFGFYVFDYDYDEGLIKKYRAFEASILPKQRAANPWASFQIINQENTMAFTTEQRKALVMLHNEALVKALEDEDEKQAALLDAAGVETKILTGAEAAAEEKGENPDGYATQKEVVDALDKQEAVFAEVVKYLVGKIEALEKKLSDKVEGEVAAAKVAAAPISVLAARMPLSLLDQAKLAADANAAAQTRNSAQISGNSSLARSKPAATGARKGAAVTISDIPQGGN